MTLRTYISKRGYWSTIKLKKIIYGTTDQLMGNVAYHTVLGQANMPKTRIIVRLI